MNHRLAVVAIAQAGQELRVRSYRLALLSVFLVVGFLISGCSNSETFEPEVWKRGDHRQRGKMVKALVRSEILVGKTKEEVTDLLGPSDSQHEEGRDQVYIVDLGHKFGSDPWTYQLHVRFSAEHDVVETVWYTD